MSDTTTAAWRNIYKRRPNLIKILVGLMSVILLLAVTVGLWAPPMYWWLTYSEAPQQADIAVALGGHPERIRNAARLYEDGTVPLILVSGAQGTIVAYTAKLYDMGVPPRDVLASTDSDSTLTEAEANLAVLQSLAVDSAIVTSSEWHMRRVRAVYDHVFAGSGIELSYVGTPNEVYDGDSWFLSTWGLRQIIGEYFKIIYYASAFGIVSF